MKHIVEVRPSYGWGWADPDGAASDIVPEPFHADVESKIEVRYDQSVRTLQGTVTEKAHELDGFAVLLSQRHEDWDGHVNIKLRSNEGRELRGFGSVDLASFDG